MQAKKNPKAFLRYVNSRLKTRGGTTDLKSENGEVLSDDETKATAFNNFFSSVFTKEDRQNIPHIDDKKPDHPFDDLLITAPAVYEVLRKLQPDKSPGPDNIHPRILKECAVELAMPLTILFQSTLTEGCVPQEWKQANVTPIYKKGSRSDVGNYRPISLTSVCCKVMERLVRHALLDHMICNGFMSEYQHGFARG